MRLLSTIALVVALCLATAYGAGECWQSSWNDTVTLSSGDDGAMYSVAQSNLLILIDGNLTFDSTAIDLGNYDYIEIRGNTGGWADTIFWNDDGKDTMKGVFSNWGNHKIGIADVVFIHNGGNSAKNNNAFDLYDADSVYFDSVYANITGDAEATHGAHVINSSGLGNGISMIKARYCTFESTVDTQDQRQGVPAATLKLTANYSIGTDTLASITNCAINSSWVGIRVQAKNNNGDRPTFRIEDNTITGDLNLDGSLGAMGDPFQIDLFWAGAGIIRGNTIQSGDAYRGCQGILVNGAGTSDSLLIDSNTLLIHCCVEAGSDDKGIGMYFRWPTGDPLCYNQHIKIRDNTIRVWGDKDTNTPSYASTVEAVRMHFDSASQYIEFTGNTIEALRKDSLETDTGDVLLICVEFARGDTTGAFEDYDYYDGSVMMDVWSADISNITLGNNNYYSHEHIFGFGSLAAFTHGANHIYSYDDTINVNIKPNCDTATFVFNAEQGHSIDNWLIDPVLQGDADTTFDWGIFRTSPQDSCLGRNLKVARALELLVVDSTDTPINGASVTIESAYGEYSTGNTNASGVYADELPAFHFWDNESIKSCSEADSNYLNYRFIASYDGQVDTLSDVDIYNDWDGKDTIQLGADAGDPGEEGATGSALIWGK